MKALNLFRKKSDKTANRIIPVIILWFLFSSFDESSIVTSFSTGSSTTPGQKVPSSSEEKNYQKSHQKHLKIQKFQYVHTEDQE